MSLTWRVEVGAGRRSASTGAPRRAAAASARAKEDAKLGSLLQGSSRVSGDRPPPECRSWIPM
eukprot:3019279-Rhodomonas_salina.2